MKPSTLAELAGFGAITFGAFRLGTTAGVFVGGLCLLLIGYAIEDTAAALQVGRIVTPIRSRILLARVRRQNRKSRKRQNKPATPVPPQEVVVRVKAD